MVELFALPILALSMPVTRCEAVPEDTLVEAFRLLAVVVLPTVLPEMVFVPAVT